jgi:membrane-associated protease RseP (regulator of RpoE activity)
MTEVVESGADTAGARAGLGGTGSGEPTPEEQRANLIRLLAGVAVVVALALTTGAFPTVVVIVALLVIVMLHELGHFLTAKWSGMKVTEFFLGFGPRLWSVRKGETEYGIKAIPAGGYVRIVGMNNLEQVPPADEPRAYRQQTFPRRLAVALAGSTVHFLLAYFLLYALAAGFGLRHLDHWEVGTLSRLGTGEAPAVEAGLRLGDRVVTVDGRPADDWEALRDYIRDRPGERVRLLVERDDQPIEVPVTLADRNPEGEKVGFLGIGPTFPRVREGPVEAVWSSGGELGNITSLSARALASFFTPSNLGDYADQLAGKPQAGDEGEAGEGSNRFLSPVGFTRVASQAADSGASEVVMLLVLINVFVGMFNLVPLLPLDGGHVAIAVYERIRSRHGRRYHADVARLLPLTYAVVAVIVTLGVTSLWLDIARPLANPFE